MSAAVSRPSAGLFRRLLENPGAVAGLAIMVVLIVVAAVAPIIAPHGPAEQFRESFLTPPFQQAVGVVGQFMASVKAQRSDNRLKRAALDRTDKVSVKGV